MAMCTKYVRKVCAGFYTQNLDIHTYVWYYVDAGGNEKARQEEIRKMINMIVKYTWTEKDGKTAWEYRVYHDAVDSFSRGRRYDYDCHKNLPKTVVEFLLNANNVRTVYERFAQRQNLKVEYFKK